MDGYFLSFLFFSLWCTHESYLKILAYAGSGYLIYIDCWAFAEVCSHSSCFHDGICLLLSSHSLTPHIHPFSILLILISVTGELQAIPDEIRSAGGAHLSSGVENSGSSRAISCCFRALLIPTHLIQLIMMLQNMNPRLLNCEADVLSSTPPCDFSYIIPCQLNIVCTFCTNTTLLIQYLVPVQLAAV